MGIIDNFFKIIAEEIAEEMTTFTEESDANYSNINTWISCLKMNK